ILLHGLVIWQDPFQRAAALLIGMAILVGTGVVIHRGALRPRAVVEVRLDRRSGGKAAFSLVGNGRPLPSGVELRYDAREEHREAAEGTLDDFRALRAVEVALPP